MALRSDGVPNCTVAVEAKQSSLDTDIREPCYKPSELWLALPSELKHGRAVVSVPGNPCAQGKVLQPR